MKSLKTIMIAAAVLAAGAGAAGTDTGRSSMKGWELYTWFDPACSASPQAHSAPNEDSWCAALVEGTNRLKKPAEIKRAPIKWKDLAPALAGLRAGEDVAWITTPGTFEPPGPRLRDAIAAVAKDHGLHLAAVARDRAPGPAKAKAKAP